MAAEQIIAIFTLMTLIEHKRSLKELNSFGLDNMALHFARPLDMETLSTLLDHDTRRQMPLLILGEGSNILFRNNFEGLVIQPGMTGIRVVEEHEDELVVEVGASENWDRWVAFALDQGWYGLENLSLIPGSVGSSPVQNIGAYGVELKDCFEWLEAWDLQEHQPVRLDHQTCRFSYRNSIFKGEASGRYIITRVAFRLKRKPKLQLEYGNVKKEFTKAHGSTPRDLRQVIIQIRNTKLPDPARYGNAGSFFKNPLVDNTIFNCIRVEYPEVPRFPAEDNQLKIPAAWLIEKSGWKGKRIGHVGTWPSQPLVLVNYGRATGQEIYDFSELIVADVDRKFGITLEREVRVI
jgi:UDP-N-acetylmuramate dehydrogenase